MEAGALALASPTSSYLGGGGGGEGGGVGGVSELVFGPAHEAFDTGLACNRDLADSGADGDHGCHTGGACAYWSTNPNHGITSFDSVAMVFIALVQATTFDDWAEAMYARMTSPRSHLLWASARRHPSSPLQPIASPPPLPGMR